MNPLRSASALLGLLSITACASAPADSGDQITTQADAGVFGFVDSGPRPDASPFSLADAAVGDDTTLTQSSSTSITDLNSIACTDAFGFTVENHYYRKFDLSASGMPSGFAVDRVSLGVETATAQDVDVALYTLTGDFAVANLTELARQPFSMPDVADGSPTVVDVDVSATAPAGSTLVVELEAPDNGGILYVGSNTAGETGPTYIRASGCSIDAPTPVGEVSDATMHWVLTLSGSSL